MTRLFVANVSYHATEDDLSAAFSAFGPLKECLHIQDRQSDRHKGYAFVEFQSPLDAEAALKALDETELLGRRIVVREATKPRRDK